MERTRLWTLAAVLLLCVATPLAAFAAEDIPPANERGQTIFMDEANETAPEDDVIFLPEPGGVTRAAEEEALAAAAEEDTAGPLLDGTRNADIENSPALRMNTQAAATTTTAEERTELADRVTITNEPVPTTGAPSIWMPVLGGILMLGAVPAVLRKKS